MLWRPPKGLLTPTAQSDHPEREVFVLLLLAASAFAGGVDDLAIAAQRGMPTSVLQALAANVDQSLTSEDVVRLLRSGVPERMIAALAEGHPTAEESAAALAAGRLLYVPPPPPAPPDEPGRAVAGAAPAEYKSLTDRAWLELVGVPIVLTTLDGPLVCVLTETHTPTAIDPADTLTVETEAGLVVVQRASVVSVRRVDGARVTRVTRGDFRERDVAEGISDVPVGDDGLTRQERAQKSGGAMVAGGSALLALGALSFVASQVELSATTVSAGQPDWGETQDHATAYLTWSAISYTALGIGAPLTVGGVLVLSFGGAPDR